MSKRTRKNKILKPLIAVITVAAVIVGAFFGYRWYSEKKKQALGTDVSGVDTVTRGNLEVAITGEASVEPYERYEIISMVSGDIISSPYDVGDNVEEGAVLYQFDTADAQASIKKQEISLEQSQNSLNNAKNDLQEAQSKLVVTAPNSGIISGLTIKKGSSVSNNESIAQVENTQQMEVTLPFTAEQTSSIYVGQSAVLSSSAHMSSVGGYVESISSRPVAQEDGSVIYNVKIGFTNPGSFTKGLTVGGEINGMQSPGYGTVEVSESGTAKTEASGTVLQVYCSNGDFVTAGSTIATISSDSLSSQQRTIKSSELSLKSAQLSMQETRDSLDDYSIKSPISGTVITKNAKAGDTIDRTNSSTALMVVADISKLKFSLEIDELDVSSVKEGQRVDITCDALPNEEFEGSITSISVEGTATNGVTTYTAEIVIENPGNLRPSMNIDASVIVESSENTLIIPTADIKTAMGVSYVFLKNDGNKTGATEEDFMKAIKESRERTMENDGANGIGEAPSGAEQPQGEASEGVPIPTGEAPVGGRRTRGEMGEGTSTDNAQPTEYDNENSESGKDKSDETSSDKEKESQDKNAKGADSNFRLPEAPEGFVIAIVKTGISDDENTEILSGLSEGDQVQQLSTSSSSQQNNMRGMQGMGGGMSGGMPGGAIPGGGGGMPVGGGMPGGR